MIILGKQKDKEVNDDTIEQQGKDQQTIRKGYVEEGLRSMSADGIVDGLECIRLSLDVSTVMSGRESRGRKRNCMQRLISSKVGGLTLSTRADSEPMTATAISDKFSFLPVTFEQRRGRQACVRWRIHQRTDLKSGEESRIIQQPSTVFWGITAE